MAIQLSLSEHEAALLKVHLDRYLEHLERDLVRTDKHELQHDLAREVEELQSIAERLERQNAPI